MFCVCLVTTLSYSYALTFLKLNVALRMFFLCYHLRLWNIVGTMCFLNDIPKISAEHCSKMFYLLLMHRRTGTCYRERYAIWRPNILKTFPRCCSENIFSPLSWWKRLIEERSVTRFFTKTQYALISYYRNVMKRSI